MNNHRLPCVLLAVLLLLASCRKHKAEAPTDPLTLLPAYTETGAGTFGCLIDGEAFVPKKHWASLEVSLQCYYQIVNYTEIYFSLSAKNAYLDKYLGINIDYKYLIKNKTYKLGSFTNDSSYATLGIYSGETIYFTRSTNYVGEMSIGYLDTINQIVSGTFWFDAVDTSSGKGIHVTNGRFDLHYTR
ncbi:MAG: hypothetical protein QM642_10420 [Edaphocola sp.]